MDTRIGYVDEDGRRVWPPIDINGAAYDRSNYGAEVALGGGRFVIVPQGFDEWAKIAEVGAANDGSAKDGVRRRGNVSRPSEDAE